VALAKASPYLSATAPASFAVWATAACRQRHEPRVAGDGDEAEALADHLGGVACRAVMDAGEQVAFLDGG
jgi:hypothetical protein